MPKEKAKKNKTDLLISTAKSIVGIVPFAGPLLSELVGTLIPNQRIDRLSKYVNELDEKLSRFEVDYLKQEIQNEECSDLFEEGFRQAARTLTDDRRRYIASIIQNSLDEEHISYVESKHLMQILQELNDIEIIWLRSYQDPTLGGDKEFREKHKDVLKSVHAHFGVSQDVLDKDALQRSYKEHLERLGLIQAHYNLNRETGLPEFDRFSGKQKVSYYSTSSLGRLLLKYIGLIDENG